MSTADGTMPPLMLSVVQAGADLLGTLARLASGADAWINATGYVEGVELRVAGDGTNPIRKLSGRYTLVQLTGRSGGPFAVTLARAVGGGFEFAAGELLRARSAGVTAAVQAARVVVATADDASRAATSDDEEEQEEFAPEAGDLVEHFAFGLCDVLTADGDRLRIRDVKPPGRVREVALGMLEVLAPIESDGRKLFRLVRRTPG